MPSEAEMNKIFDAFDTSGDGFISPEELEAALKKGGKKVTSKDIETILKTVDTNKDSKVSREEFMKVFDLAPDALPAGLQPLVDVTGSMLTNLGKAGKIVWDPVAGIVGGAVGWTQQALKLSMLNDEKKAEVKDAFDEVAKGSGKLNIKSAEDCLSLLGKAPMDMKGLMGGAKEVDLETFYVMYERCEDADSGVIWEASSPQLSGHNIPSPL
uniref:EF-hand domain-containing protein n=1 Tax=Haptolina brevifila TaxID=156173 RepID=A0A7S2HQB5_9EUKA|mmetsp:Transcript_56837/g.112919  ORF Transcript_56837/g.112919 Transcript_56837/m.112919 type:complete len:212 (+) Transcript_56837:34-669(+)